MGQVFGHCTRAVAQLGKHLFGSSNGITRQVVDQFDDGVTLGRHMLDHDLVFDYGFPSHPAVELHPANSG
ncbi:MAG: hypothetical protein AW09_002878 [Candidatus Accumulibacter phosphatis]|uniref:Uncharacterized protein n=1 Tax=Candidatus Accumulibacter phosphatis TaxID=327160 RepID=A0A080LTZ5_9PROT|nr:MAG: hypothetical protein AW09_002878 [Candidatus Accumulibacter phosphatis]